MAARDAFDRHRKWLVVLAVVLGIVLIVIAVVYWVEPAARCRRSSPATRRDPTTTT